MSKIWAIHSGGDWADASAEYIILPEGMDIQEEKEKYRTWYKNVYLPMSPVKYIDFYEWLLSRGGFEPSRDQLEIFTEYL